MEDVPLYLSQQNHPTPPLGRRLAHALYNTLTLAVMLFVIAYTVTIISEGHVFWPDWRNIAVALAIGLGMGLYNQFIDYQQRYRLLDESQRLSLEDKGQWLKKALEASQYELTYEDEQVSVFRPRFKIRRWVNLDNRVDVYQIMETFDLVAPRSIHFRVNKTLEVLQKVYYQQRS